MGTRTTLPVLGRWGASRLGRGKPLAKRPRAPAAFRIPQRGPLSTLLPGSAPHLFVHEGARQALERRLRTAFDGPVTVSITDNRQSIISHTTERGVLHARIHHMFLDASPGVVEALVLYLVRGDRAASLKVGQYIDANVDRVDRRAHRRRLVSKGAHHDLLALYSELNARYFHGGVHALVTWGQSRKARREVPRQTIKLGSYSAAERLIVVHPALDRAWVPRYFVAFIVYHEMLHHAVPACGTGERRLLHSPEFRDRELAFRHIERALAWEKRFIGRLLRS